MKEISILFTRHETRDEGGERGKKNINFPLKDSNLRPSDFTIWSFLSFLVNEPWNTVDT